MTPTERAKKCIDDFHTARGRGEEVGMADIIERHIREAVVANTVWEKLEAWLQGGDRRIEIRSQDGRVWCWLECRDTDLYVGGKDSSILSAVAGALEKAGVK